MSELVDLLRSLVAIDSVNPDLVPGGAGEGQIAHFVADWLARAGLEVTRDEPAPGRPNIVAIARGSGGGRTLLLNAHMDTVGVSGMERPFDPLIEGNRLFGRGAYDMKGGLATIMIAAAAARKHQLRGDLIVTAVADEEYASIGSQSIVKRWHADAAIVTEPTHQQLCVAHKGFIWLDIETEGVAAHGSRPDLGVDAIVKMGKVLVRLEELAHSLQAGPHHPLLGSSSVHASLISGGQELSSYPERCRLSVERRTIPGETPETVRAEVGAILRQLAETDSECKAAFTMGLARDAFAIATDAPIVQTLRRHATAALGQEPDLVGVPYWMDTALLAAAGIPTVAFGSGGGGAHAVVEWVDLDQVQACAAIVLATALEFCA